MAETFNCTMCGVCCSKIRGKLPKEEEDFLRKNAFGKMPLFQLIPLENTSFPLWDWEAKRFKRWQNEVGIDAKINPSRAIYDLKRNLTIIVTYHMDYDSCPFQKDKGCLIYDKERAFVCRLFPLQRTPFLDISDKPKPCDLLGSCHVVLDVMDKIPSDRDDMIRWFEMYFKDGSFLNAVQNDIVTEWVNMTIIGLIKQKVIKPAMNYPYDRLLEIANKSKKVGLTDFLADEKVFTRQKINSMIERFDDNSDAKEKLLKLKS